MKDNTINLIVEVEYEGQKYEIKEENKINYEELVKRVIKQFNINENKKDYLEFKYIDEDGDTNILSPDDNLFDIAQDNDEDYLLKLNLSITQYINKRNKIKRNSRLFNINIKEDDDEDDNEDENNDNIISTSTKKKDKKDEIETIKNEYKNQIKKINEIYKKQIENIRNDFIDIINKKCRKIKSAIIKYKIDIDEANLNFENNYQKIKIKEKDEESSDDVPNDSDEEDIKDSIVISGESNKINESFRKIKSAIKSKRNSIVNFIQPLSKKRKKCLENIKKSLKAIHKKYEDYENEIIKKGKDIQTNLNKENLKLKDMNIYYDEYLKKKNKENKMPEGKMVEHYIILKKMNHCLETVNLKNIVDEYFIHEGEIKDIIYNLSKDTNDYQKQIIKHLKYRTNN